MNDKTLLFVDDEESLRDVILTLFEALGYNMFTACSGQEGIQQCQHNQIDLIIFDFIATRFHHLEFLIQLHRFFQNILVFALHSVTPISDEDLAISEKAGVTGAYGRPMGIKAMIVDIKNLLGK